MLDVAEYENKQFCHVQAAALALSAYFSEFHCLFNFISAAQVKGENFQRVSSVNTK